MLQLYFSPGACSFVPHVGLEAIKAAGGPDFEPKLVKLHKGEQKTPEYLAMNPNGQVPVLVADGKPDSLIVFTSMADDAFGGDTMGDGALTTPAPGQWQGIQFTAVSNDLATGIDDWHCRYDGLSYAEDGTPESGEVWWISRRWGYIRHGAARAVADRTKSALHTGTIAGFCLDFAKPPPPAGTNDCDSSTESSHSMRCRRLAGIAVLGAALVSRRDIASKSKLVPLPCQAARSDGWIERSERKSNTVTSGALANSVSPSCSA